MTRRAENRQLQFAIEEAQMDAWPAAPAREVDLLYALWRLSSPSSCKGQLA